MHLSYSHFLLYPPPQSPSLAIIDVVMLIALHKITDCEFCHYAVLLPLLLLPLPPLLLRLGNNLNNKGNIQSTECLEYTFFIPVSSKVSSSFRALFIIPYHSTYLRNPNSSTFGYGCGNKSTTASFQIHSNSLFTSHPAIRLHTILVRGTRSVVVKALCHKPEGSGFDTR
jgi:hypothetical protein